VSLTLYDGHGRRWMTMESNGPGWKGASTPAE
jgi:hypothetical protein